MFPCANVGFPQGEGGMDGCAAAQGVTYRMVRAEKAAPRGLAGCWSSPKKRRVGMAGYREQPPPSQHLLACGVRLWRLCMVHINAGEAKGKIINQPRLQRSSGESLPWRNTC